jgi:hypothetical protein
VRRETGETVEPLWGDETDPDRFKTLNREQAQVSPPVDRAGMRLFTAVLQVAINEAHDSEHGKELKADWVAILSARDWLRHSAYEYMVETIADCTIQPSTYAKKLAEWELNWDLQDHAREANDPVVIVETQGAIPMELVTTYLLQIQYRAILAEKEMSRVNRELAPVFQAEGQDLMVAVKWVRDELAALSPRIKWVSASLEDQTGRMERLHDLIDQRGVSLEEENDALKSNPETAEGDAS